MDPPVRNRIEIVCPVNSGRILCMQQNHVTWRCRIDGCLLHDPLTVAILIEPDLAQYEERIVDVELLGSLTRGRAVWWTEDNLRLHVGLRVPSSIRPVRVATRVDNGRLVDLMLSAFSGGVARADPVAGAAVP